MADDYVRFVVLSYGRTGSTYLVKEFNSRPDTVMMSELFHPSPGSRATVGDQAWEEGTNSWRFVKDNVFVPHPAEIRAVGFKLFYFHARKAEADRAIWRQIALQPTIRLVLLGRQNIFAGFVSEQRARATSIWHPKTGQPQYYAAVDLEIDVAEAERYLKSNRERERFGAELSGGHPSLVINYEDMQTDSTAALRRMAEFLDLPASDWTPSPFLSGSADHERTRITNLNKVTTMLQRNDAEWMAAPFVP